MAVYYLGAFPIEGGGVTNKNRDIYNALTDSGLNIEKVDLNLIKRKKDIHFLLKFIKALFPGNCYIVGVSGTRNTSVKLTKLLRLVCPWNLKKSLYFMMGGTEAKKIAENPKLKKMYCYYEQIYVETASMCDNMMKAGMKNVSVFPNCRPKPIEETPIITDTHNQLNCLFFSYIDPEKGVDTILETAAMLPDVSFSFYGNIKEEYRETFNQRIAEMPNCKYCGFFCGDVQEIYKILRGYSMILFPTRYKNEGVPGILIEAKMACVPVIASDNSYNSEIVEDGIDGIILNKNDTDTLFEIINILKRKPELLCSMKNNCKYTANKYYMESYIGEILQRLS